MTAFKQKLQDERVMKRKTEVYGAKGVPKRSQNNTTLMSEQ